MFRLLTIGLLLGIGLSACGGGGSTLPTPGADDASGSPDGAGGATGPGATTSGLGGGGDLQVDRQVPGQGEGPLVAVGDLFRLRSQRNSFGLQHHAPGARCLPRRKQRQPGSPGRPRRRAWQPGIQYRAGRAASPGGPSRAVITGRCGRSTRYRELRRRATGTALGSDENSYRPEPSGSSWCIVNACNVQQGDRHARRC